MNRIVNGIEVPMTNEEISAWEAEQQALGAPSWSEYQGLSRAALEDSDVTVLRCIEHGVAVPDEWVAYRKSLRAIVGATSGDATLPLPVRPAYPPGT